MTYVNERNKKVSAVDVDFWWISIYWSTFSDLSSATDGSTRHFILRTLVHQTILGVNNTLTHQLLPSHWMMAPLSQASLVC
jgi:hypothetical protein